MSYRAPLPTFAGGEIGPQVAARYDTAKYQTALERGRNTLGLPGGGQYNRPGFEFCAPLKDYTKAGVLIPFVFAVDQSYALEFTPELMRVYSGGDLVTRPPLAITAITKANPMVVTIPANGYQVGWDVYFSGILGMTELNGRTLRVTAVAGDLVTFAIDSTGFSTFTGDTGGVAGGSEGGTGGYPVPPSPGDEPPPTYPDDPGLPPRCVWDQAWLSANLRAYKAEVGTPLVMLSEDGEEVFDGEVRAISFHMRPGVRLETANGVMLTCSSTAPVPVLRDGSIVYVRAEKLVKSDRVRVRIGSALHWDAITRSVNVGAIRVAQISADDGVYLAGDRQGAGIFTHNIKQNEIEPAG